MVACLSNEVSAMAAPALFGPLMVLTFCLSQAFRDVYFANIFQGLDFFAVIVNCIRSVGLDFWLSDGGSIAWRLQQASQTCSDGDGDERHHCACMDLLLFRPQAP
jgi:hypothetical protein